MKEFEHLFKAMKNINFYSESVLTKIGNCFPNSKLVQKDEFCYLIFRNSNLILILEFRRFTLVEIYYNFSQKFVKNHPLDLKNQEEGDYMLTTMIQSISRAVHLWTLCHVFEEGFK